MSQTEMFQALHPDPEKQGTRVTKATYDAYKDALLKVIPTTPEGIEYGQLSEAIRPHMAEGILQNTSPMWWVTTVKLDLEARGLLERIPGKSKQRVRLVNQ